MNDNILLLQEYNINYTNKQATLLSVSYALNKQKIDEYNDGWNVLPMFASKIPCQLNEELSFIMDMDKS